MALAGEIPKGESVWASLQGCGPSLQPGIPVPTELQMQRQHLERQLFDRQWRLRVFATIEQKPGNSAGAANAPPTSCPTTSRHRHSQPLAAARCVQPPAAPDGGLRFRCHDAAQSSHAPPTCSIPENEQVSAARVAIAVPPAAPASIAPSATSITGEQGPRPTAHSRFLLQGTRGAETLAPMIVPFRRIDATAYRQVEVRRAEPKRSHSIEGLVGTLDPPYHYICGLSFS